MTELQRNPLLDKVSASSQNSTRETGEDRKSRFNEASGECTSNNEPQASAPRASNDSASLELPLTRRDYLRWSLGLPRDSRRSSLNLKREPESHQTNLVRDSYAAFDWRAYRLIVESLRDLPATTQRASSEVTELKTPSEESLSENKPVRWGRRFHHRFHRRMGKWREHFPPARRWINSQTRRAYRSLLELVLPPVCSRCHTPLAIDESAIWCLACERDLGIVAQESWMLRHQCFRCGTLNPQCIHDQAVRLSIPAEACEACRRVEFPFDSVVALGEYHATLRRWIIDAKHSCEPQLVAGLSRMLARRLLQRHVFRDWDRVVPVPSRGRWSYEGPTWLSSLQWLLDRCIRGRSGELPLHLAERIAQFVGLPLSQNLVQYRRFTRKQGKLDQRQRWHNVSGAMQARQRFAAARRLMSLVPVERVRRLFSCFRGVDSDSAPRSVDSFLPLALSEKCVSSCQDAKSGSLKTNSKPMSFLSRLTAERPLLGEKILVVDDVMTTGATLAEVTRVLKELGASEVHIAVLARAAPRR